MFRYVVLPWSSESARPPLPVKVSPAQLTTTQMMPAMWMAATAARKMVHCCSGVRWRKGASNMLPTPRVA